MVVWLFIHATYLLVVFTDHMHGVNISSPAYSAGYD